MSVTPHPNTSSNGIQPPEITPDYEPSQLTIERLQDHISKLVDEVQQMPELAPTTPDNQTPDLTDFAALLSLAEVKADEEVLKPPVCLTIQQNDQPIIIATLGNVSAIIGKAKSRKTSALSMLVSSLVKQGVILSRFTGTLPPDRPVVLCFDTEQGRYHVHRAIRRICDLSGQPKPPNLKTYALRAYPTHTRLEVIRWALYNTPGLGFVVIDGIRDLVFDINSPEEATTIATNLLKWTDDLQIHIIVVLHQNKGNADARGHLGTELINKAETVISISREADSKDISVIAPEYCRDKDFEPFAFSIDEQGLPYLIDALPVGNTSLNRTRKPTVDTMSTDDINAIVRRAFSNDKQLRYSQLRTNIIEASEFVGIPLAKSRAESFIQRVEVKGYLIKFQPPSQRYEAYKINADTLPI